jgi:RNA polymerase sigma factor (TIGR02999 family)
MRSDKSPDLNADKNSAVSFEARRKPGDTKSMFDQVYDRLKAMASRQLAKQPSETLETTALVHELYLRLAQNRELIFEHEHSFFSYAARAMRHLLFDRAREHMSLQAGGEWVAVTLTGGSSQYAITSAHEALALDQALMKLEQVDPRAAEIVELRYFAGLNETQIAQVLGVARRTVTRDWRFARAFLHECMD